MSTNKIVQKFKDLYSPQELPLLVPSVPRDCGILASPLEVGPELFMRVSMGGGGGGVPLTVDG